MRNPRSPLSRQTTHVLVAALQTARFEVLPTATVEDKVLEHVPTGRAITVTASPAKGLEPTLDLTERLAKQGYVVTPHLAARMMRDRSQLSEVCDRLTTAGVRSVFVPAGDQTPPEGVYDGALPLLEDLTALGQPFEEVGITGYPESHPLINDDVVVQAMWDKRRHATQIVSNLVFDAGIVDSWLVRLRARGIQLPVWLGIPGPAERAKLLTMATKIGVGDSAKFLVKHRRTMLRLAAPGGFTGERFLADCAPAMTRQGAGVAGLHVFTFNQVAETEKWRLNVLDRLQASGTLH